MVSEIIVIEFERFKRPFCLVYDRRQLIHQVSLYATIDKLRNGYELHILRDPRALRKLTREETKTAEIGAFISQLISLIFLSQ